MMDKPKRKLARRMRRNPVAAEQRLWSLLRDRRLESIKLRRQVPLGPYVVDFLSLRHRLVLEADGPLHDTEHDAVRDSWLVANGFRVLRFPNARIQLWGQRVIDDIRRAAGITPTLTGPLEDFEPASLPSGDPSFPSRASG